MVLDGNESDNETEYSENNDDDERAHAGRCRNCVLVAWVLGTFLLAGGMALWLLLEKTPLPSIPSAIMIVVGSALDLVMCTYCCCCRADKKQNSITNDDEQND